MPNETHVKRLIADAVFEAHHKLPAEGQIERKISREEARTVASVIFDALHRTNSVVIEPSKPNLEHKPASQREALLRAPPEPSLKVIPAERREPRVSSLALDANLKSVAAERREPPQRAPSKADSLADLARTAERREPRVSQRAPSNDSLADLARALLDEQPTPEDGKSVFSGVGVAIRLLLVIILIGVGIGAYAYSTGRIQPTFLTRFF